MEYVIKELLHPEEDDEANFIYSELDSQRRETRRVEFYPSGMCFAYGGDMGQDEVLNPAPFPEDLRTLNRPGEVEVRAIPRQLFNHICGRQDNSIRRQNTAERAVLVDSRRRDRDAPRGYLLRRRPSSAEWAEALRL